MIDVQVPLMHRLDAQGVIVRQRRQLDMLAEILVGDHDDAAPEWWRSLADRYEEVDAEAADRFRAIAALIEETNL